MTTHCRFLTVHSLLSAVCFAVLVAGAAAAQTAPCPEGGAPTAVCTFVDDAWPYDVFLEQACTRSLMAGCGDEYACPGEAVLREDMAVSLERLYRGHTFNPSAACASQCTFADFKASYCLAGWICQLFKDGITAGCAAGYCGPEAVRREQMAVFLSVVISKRLGQTIPSAGQVCRAPGECKPYTRGAGAILAVRTERSASGPDARSQHPMAEHLGDLADDLLGVFAEVVGDAKQNLDSEVVEEKAAGKHDGG